MSDGDAPRLERARGQRGSRLRALAVVGVALAVIGMGAYARMASPEPQRRVAVAIPSPVPAATPLVAGPRPLNVGVPPMDPPPLEPVATPGSIRPLPQRSPPVPIMSLGDDGLIGDVAKAASLRTATTAVLVATLMLAAGPARRIALLGGPNDFTGASALTASDGGQAATLRLRLEGRTTNVVRQVSVTLPPTAPDPAATGCELLHEEYLAVPGQAAGATEDVAYRFMVGVVVRSGQSVLSVRLVRAPRLWTNLSAPPPIKATCA